MPRPIRQDFEFNTEARGLRRLDDLRDGIDDLRAETEDFAEAAEDAGSAADGAEGGILNFGNAFKAALGALSGAAVFEAAQSAIQGIASSTIGAVIDMNSAMNRFEAQTGISGDALDEFEGVAERVFASGRGESFQEVVDAMQQASTITGTQFGPALETLTERALVFSEVFDRDITESIRSANTAAENFELSTTAAFDVLTVAIQQSGDPAQDLLDTFNEYSANFADMGFSFEEFASLMVTGLDAGARNTDDLADAMREYQIRLRDGTSEQAIFNLGLEDTYAAFQRGEVSAADLWEQVRFGLASIEDPLARNALGVEIFGTKWEDTGGAAILAMEPMSDMLADVEGATDRAGEALDRGVGPAWERFKRQIQVGLANAIEPLVERGLNVAVDLLDQLGGWINNVGMPLFGDFFGLIGDGAAWVADFVGQFVNVKDVLGGAIDLVRDYIDAYTSWFDLGALRDAFQGDPLAALGIGEAGGFEALGRELLNQLATGLTNVAGFWRDRIIMPIIDAVRSIDWAAVPGQLWEIVQALARGYVNWMSWLLNNIYIPIANAILEFDWSGLLSDLAGAISDAFMGGSQWFADNFWAPIIDGLDDNVQVQGGAQAVGEAFRAFLDGAIDFIGDIPAWVNDNIIQPVVNALSGGGGGGGGDATAEAGRSFGENLLRNLAIVFVNLADWVVTNVIDPFLVGFTGADTSALLVRLHQFGMDLLQSIADGIPEIPGWLWTNLIAPLVAAISSIDYALLAAVLLEVGEHILRFIADGIGDIAVWLWENLIQPLIDAVPGVLESIGNAFLSIGESIVTGIVNGIAGLGEQLFQAMSAEVATIANRELIPGSGISINNVGEILGFAGGGVMEGFGIVGERGPELAFAGQPTAIVSHQDSIAAVRGAFGIAAPAPASAPVMAGGGTVINLNGTINLPGVKNARDFLRELEREAGRNNRSLTSERGRT